MPILPLKDLSQVDRSGDFIVETNVDIPLPTTPPDAPDDPCLVRANIYRPKAEGRYPVLVTYGPYGKDIHYSAFHPASFAEVNEKQKSAYSAWETPEPSFWTSQGYVVVRADERGTGQSPGVMNVISPSTTHAFFDVIEWASQQLWSSGKVGLLGISYYALTQWWVASRRPRGLEAIVPWEGMSDYYSDCARHGGILANTFFKSWYDRQVASNQYGQGDRAGRDWGPDTLEGTMSEDELRKSRREPAVDIAKSLYRDDALYFADQFPLENIECPLLSVANWGGISLHLQGNVRGYTKAGSKFKYLRFIAGRHDLPFYYDEEVAVQKSFLDAFLKGEDNYGWSIPGKVPPVDLCLRRGNPGVNNAVAELATFPRRHEKEWPIERTIYTDFYLSDSTTLERVKPTTQASLSYEAPGGLLTFYTPPFTAETEVTGHPSACLSVSLSSRDGSTPSDIDLFLSLHHIDGNGQEISYTGTTGEPVPIVFGWQRVSLSKVADGSALIDKQRFISSDVEKVVNGQVYDVQVEIWPTNVVIGKGHKLALKIASSDSHKGGFFFHNDQEDRAEAKFKGYNHIHVGGKHESFLRLPIIPQLE